VDSVLAGVMGRAGEAASIENLIAQMRELGLPLSEHVFLALIDGCSSVPFAGCSLSLALTLSQHTCSAVRRRPPSKFCTACALRTCR
jgi:hypothetical protein